MKNSVAVGGILVRAVYPPEAPAGVEISLQTSVGVVPAVLTSHREMLALMNALLDSERRVWGNGERLQLAR